LDVTKGTCDGETEGRSNQQPDAHCCTVRQGSTGRSEEGGQKEIPGHQARVLRCRQAENGRKTEGPLSRHEPKDGGAQDEDREETGRQRRKTGSKGGRP
jgi:hypothetical protein